MSSTARQASVVSPPMLLTASSTFCPSVRTPMATSSDIAAALRSTAPAGARSGSRWPKLSLPSALPFPRVVAQPASPTSCGLPPYSPPPPTSLLRSIGGARRLPKDCSPPIGFPAEPHGGSTAGEWVAASPRRNVLAVGQRGATFLSHVTGIAAEVAHGLSDRSA